MPLGSSHYPLLSLARASKWLLSTTWVPSATSLGLDRDTLTRGWDSSLSKLARPCLALRTQSNLRSVIRVSGLVANFRKGIYNSRAGVKDTTFHTYASATLCRTPPLDRGCRSGTLPGIILTPKLPQQLFRFKIYNCDDLYYVFLSISNMKVPLSSARCQFHQYLVLGHGTARSQSWHEGEGGAFYLLILFILNK